MGGSHEKANLRQPLTMKKTPSSPSKIFKQYMPASQGHQNPFTSQEKMTAQQISQSKSPFRKDATKEISLFSSEKNKQVYGTCDQMQTSVNCRDHSEATSTSVGPPLRKGCMNCKSCSNNKCSSAVNNGCQNGPQMINISPIK